MKPQELRVGNFVKYGQNGFPMFVTAIGIDWLHLDFNGNESDIYECETEDVFPIPITPQWLIDNGFTVGTVLKRKNVQITPITLDTWKVIINCDNYKTELRKNIRYIHELQNCYYQATGKELCER